MVAILGFASWFFGMRLDLTVHLMYLAFCTTVERRSYGALKYRVRDISGGFFNRPSGRTTFRCFLKQSQKSS